MLINNKILVQRKILSHQNCHEIILQQNIIPRLKVAIKNIKTSSAQIKKIKNFTKIVYVRKKK